MEVKETVEKLTKEEAERIESVFFEDDVEVKLRDGKVYKIPPCSLKDARRLIKCLKLINIDLIVANFISSGDEQLDAQREEALFEALSIAFKNYPQVTREYIEEYVDIETAKKILEIMIGLNGLKK